MTNTKGNSNVQKTLKTQFALQFKIELQSIASTLYRNLKV